MRGDGEGEADVHAGRVPLDRHVEEALDFGEFHDAGEARLDLATRHPQDRAVHEDVLAAREFQMETRADLEQTRNAPTDPDPSLGRRGDPREQLEQRALPRAIPSDDTDHLTLGDREGQIAQGPEMLGRVAAL